MNHVTQAKVVRIIEHSKDIREYVLELERERKYNPGSFVQLTLDLVTASDIWPESRTFSIASYEKGIMKFIIKNVGFYTSRIFDELGVGNKCTIKYPFGDLFNKNLVNEKHLFIAGGVGITPYLSLIKYFELNNLIDNISLFYSAKYFKDLLHYESLNDTLGENMEVFITREKCTDCHSKRISIEEIKRIANKETNIYICGSKLFNKDYKELLIENGYTKIYMDEWE
jgi:ferredoxin-NADP reductase